MATAVEGFQIADGAIPLSKLAQSSAGVGEAPLWNGSAYVPGPVGGGAAADIATTSASVNVSAAAPPSAGQALVATNATHATWQTVGVTLDSAYDFGGSGAGRIITADAGAVHIDKTGNDANNALEVSVTTGSGSAVSVAMGAASTGPAIFVNSATGATGLPLRIQSNAVDVFTVSLVGAITGKTLVLAGSTSGSTTFSAGATPTPTTYTWPSAPVGGNFLQTDGSGNLSWAAAGGGGGTTYPVAPTGGTATAAGTNALAVGDTSSAAGNTSIAIGFGASAPKTSSVVVAPSTTAFNFTQTVVGSGNLVGSTANASTGSGFSTVIGNGNHCDVGFTSGNAGWDVCIGRQNLVTTADGTGTSSPGPNVAIGNTNWCGRGKGSNWDNICIGDNNQAGGESDSQSFTFQRNIAIGVGCYAAQSFGVSTAGSTDNIAIGDGASALGSHDNIAIGDFSQAGNRNTTEHDNIAIGNSAIIYGLRNIGIGFGPSISTTTAHDTIILGSATADWGGTNSQSNCIIGGTFSKPISDVWFGSGMNTGGAAPVVWSLRGSESWGTNFGAGGDLRIVSGRGWGGGTGGDLHLRTSNVSAGGAIGTEQDVGVFDHLGNARIGLATTTSTSTNGFIHIPAGTGGPPTGVPSTFSGMVPLWYDLDDDKLYVYNGGWKTTTVFA